MNHYLNNNNAAKSGVGKLIQIRVVSIEDYQEISRWLSTNQRGDALLSAARERQSFWMDANMSDDAIDEYHESNSGLDPREWMEKKKSEHS